MKGKNDNNFINKQLFQTTVVFEVTINSALNLPEHKTYSSRFDSIFSFNANIISLWMRFLLNVRNLTDMKINHDKSHMNKANKERKMYHYRGNSEAHSLVCNSDWEFQAAIKCWYPIQMRNLTEIYGFHSEITAPLLLLASILLFLRVKVT